ncbi:MAG: hypothetical protein JSW28_08920 [Thermoplasmata archaeon]|nr:MAG: hypothetical protein JSW28_08920 [Thermoplasmata archaeon]
MSGEITEKYTQIVNVRIWEQTHKKMKILDELGIKTISEFLREGLRDRVNEEFEKYLKDREQQKIIDGISKELGLE